MTKQETMFSDTADEVNSHGPDETELERLRRRVPHHLEPDKGEPFGGGVSRIHESAAES